MMYLVLFRAVNTDLLPRIRRGLWKGLSCKLSSAGNTALTYACAGGFVDVVKVLLKAGANIEDHNENGHTPLMEAASAGHVEVARVLLEYGAGINTHSNEFKESALTLACYKGIVSCLGLYFCLNLFARIYLTKTFSNTLNIFLRVLWFWVLVLNSMSGNAPLWYSGFKSVFVSSCGGYV